MTKPVVVAASVADRQRCIASLVTAFIGDPLIRWMFPEPQQYLKYFPQVLRHFAGGAFDHGSAHRTDDFNGAAMWLPPGVMPDEQSLGTVLQEGVQIQLQPEVFAFMEQVGHSHPEVPHWYLPAIGVDPCSQGRGVGSELLARSLEVCDRNNQAAYLEATNPRNIPLYQRFGFEITGSIQASSSPSIVTMFRGAR